MDGHDDGMHEAAAAFENTDNTDAEIIYAAKVVGHDPKRIAEHVLGDDISSISITHKNEFFEGAAEVLIQSGVMLTNHTSLKYKFGVPTTREEFDSFYKKKIMDGEDGHNLVSMDGKILKTEGAIEASAIINSYSLNASINQLLQAYHKKGVDSSALAKALYHKILGPADIDLDNLDKRLTTEERLSVERNAREARLYGEMGLIKSVPEQDPSGSWQKYISQQDTDKLMAKLMGKENRTNL